jgi:hypothetical protein
MNELEEEVRGVLLEAEVADLVDDDEPGAPQPGQLGEEPGRASQSNSSIVFQAANPAARMRSWAPEALRAATSWSRTAARYSSCV